VTKRPGLWTRFKENHPGVAQFLVFFLVSNGVTVLQLILMPVMKSLFGRTALIDQSFQHWGVGTNVDGSSHYIFDYAAGALPEGGGGLAYFLDDRQRPLPYKRRESLIC
jgi:hypothetical protein